MLVESGPVSVQLVEDADLRCVGRAVHGVDQRARLTGPDALQRRGDKRVERVLQPSPQLEVHDKSEHSSPQVIGKPRLTAPTAAGLPFNKSRGSAPNPVLPRTLRALATEDHDGCCVMSFCTQSRAAFGR